ncbi:hypothetical protein [Nocardia sp. XZ_19_231]|uniref:hypothetical protein n=1 Tax=Nocardia sp. XZ_19_231 TaxID=2769252 RepID=UPI001890AC84|nr:hypothetical protein [Nocardia sp. XZ_19_231]
MTRTGQTMRRVIAAAAVPAVLAVSAGTAVADPQAGVTPQASPGQAGVTPQGGGTQAGVTPTPKPAPAPDAGTALAAVIPDAPAPRQDRPMPNFWAPPQSTPQIQYDEPDTEVETEESDGEQPEVQPEPAPVAEVQLHLGADTTAIPEGVPVSLVEKWNQWNDYGVYQIALAGDALGLPREESDRRAQAGAGGMVVGGYTGAVMGGSVGSVPGCLGGAVIGGVVGGVAAGIPSAGVGSPLGAAVGAGVGCIAGSLVVGVPVMVAGMVAGGAVGAAAAAALAGGNSDNPAPAPAELGGPAVEEVPVAEQPVAEDYDGIEAVEVSSEVQPVPLVVPTNPIDDLVASVAGAANAFWAQLSAPVPPQTFQAAGA